MNAVKQRWDDAELIGKIILETKKDVYRALAVLKGTQFDGQALYDIVLSNTSMEANTQAKQIVCELKTKSTIKMERPKRKSSDDVLETPADKLRVAMWFVNKFESPAEALEAVKIAVTAVEKLDAKS